MVEVLSCYPVDVVEVNEHVVVSLHHELSLLTEPRCPEFTFMIQIKVMSKFKALHQVF